MTNRQKIMLEDEINAIQRKINEAQRFMEGANFWGRQEEAERWSNVVDEELTRINGINIALAVLGYTVGWKDNKRIIVSAGA